MTDDIVARLRDRDAYAKTHGWDNVVFGEAADRIEKLEAALRELACKCVSNCDWEKGDICPSWTARKALEGKE